MHKRMLVSSLLTAMVLLGACGHKNMVILVPDPNGAVGQINVSNAAGSVDIDTANQATVIKDPESAPGAPEAVDQEEIQEWFGEALAIQPPSPVHFMLYFETGSIHLLPESINTLNDIIATVQQQGAKHISAVGHSDTLGNKAYNLKLSMRRAVAVKDQLVERGVDEATVEVTSHGEENPLVKTADNVGNAKNRRVEVVIR